MKNFFRLVLVIILMAMPVFYTKSQEPNKPDSTIQTLIIKDRIQRAFDTINTILDKKILQQKTARHVKKPAKIKRPKLPAVVVSSDSTIYKMPAITLTPMIFDTVAATTARPAPLVKKLKWYQFRQKRLQRKNFSNHKLQTDGTNVNY